MVKTSGQKNYSDIHYTRDDVAKKIVNHYINESNNTLKFLEPAKGTGPDSGVFLKYMPQDSDWCEINEGRDFFKYQKHVDWIITNPPFSNLTQWMSKSFEVAENVVFLIPISKLFSSVPRMKLVKQYGGIREIYYLGSGRDIGFNIGFPFAAIHFQHNYNGPTTMS